MVMIVDVAAELSVACAYILPSDIYIDQEQSVAEVFSQKASLEVQYLHQWQNYAQNQSMDVPFVSILVLFPSK